MVKYFSLLVFLMVISCISYHKNEHGIYEPKHPNYSLKDKKDFIFPEKLDTINLYKYHGYYDNGIIVNKIDSNWEYIINSVQKEGYMDLEVIN